MKIIEFADFTWKIKESDEQKVGPGPNVFSSSAENVYVDSEGLHLKTSVNTTSYKAAEVILTTPLGFGTYEFEVVGDLNKLEKNTVFGAFLYEDDEHEIDIEFSPKMVGKNEGQYVIQPGKIEGNVFKFRIPKLTKSFHSITWEPEQIKFESRNLSSGKLIHQEIYEGEYIPQKQAALMIFNLWMYLGKKPKRSEEVIISDFHFKSEQ